jgi:hypothetical protein
MLRFPGANLVLREYYAKEFKCFPFDIICGILLHLSGLFGAVGPLEPRLSKIDVELGHPNEQERAKIHEQ